VSLKEFLHLLSLPHLTASPLLTLISTTEVEVNEITGRAKKTEEPDLTLPVCTLGKKVPEKSASLTRRGLCPGSTHKEKWPLDSSTVCNITFSGLTGKRARRLSL
jgi:hypothetical protein